MLRSGEIHFDLYSVLDCDTPYNKDCVFLVIFLIFHCIVLYYASLDSKAVNTLNAVLCFLFLPSGIYLCIFINIFLNKSIKVFLYAYKAYVC